MASMAGKPKKKAAPARAFDAPRTPRDPAPVAFTEPGYPTLAGLVALGPRWSERLVASVRRVAIAAAATALAACHSGEQAAPPAALHPTATPPAPPPTAPRHDTPPTPTTPPVPPALVQTGEPDVPHVGNPCPLHDDEIVLDPAAAAALPPEQREHLHPLGGLGVIGQGRPYGMGGGASAMHFAAPTVSVRDTRPTVQGNLDVDVVRRVIRRHLNEVRFCYEQARHAKPDLAGTVAVRFVVAASGTVQTSQVASSTLGDAQTEQCIVSATRRWAFPSPEGGGIALVDETFRLSGGDD